MEKRQHLKKKLIFYIICLIILHLLQPVEVCRLIWRSLTSDYLVTIKYLETSLPYLNSYFFLAPFVVLL